MRKLLLVLALTFSSMFLYAQTFNIKGVVTDAVTGETLPGVNVIVKDGAKGDVTDFDGNYKIASVPKGAVLVFSYLGYTTKEVVVDKEIINVALEESAEKLDEIVVIGYGTQRKKEVTGAVSVVSAEAIADMNPVRVEQAIQGQVAGVNITSTSGAPGAALNIRIRGISTNGNNAPLILVDGARITNLNAINPSDIESINILKDATAGIYGVQAANGVILITTKSGKKNSDFKYNLHVFGGFMQTTRRLPLLNATEYALLANEAFAANAEPLPFPDVSNLGAGTDWQDAIFQTAYIVNTEASVTKGNEKSNFRLSLGNSSQDGVIGGGKSTFSRTNIRLNYDLDITEKLKLKTSNFSSHVVSRDVARNELGSVLFNAVNMPATTAIRESNGSLSFAPTTGVGIEVVNPVAQVENTFNKTWEDRFSGSYWLTYKAMDHLTVEGRMQFNYGVVRAKSYSPEAFFGAGKVFNTVVDEAALLDNNNTTVVNESKTEFKDYIFDAFVKYEREFEDHDLKALLGMSVSRSQGVFLRNQTGFGANGTTFKDFSIGTSDSSQDNLALNNTPRQFFDSRLLSYFARVQYSYKDRYLLSAVIRRDGSSIFGPANKFGYFPSASLGWVVSDEPFFGESDVVNLLKIRSSAGIIGNDQIQQAFGFVSLINGEATYVFDDILTFGQALGNISNPEIRWEKQKTLDIGVEVGLFDKVDVTADFFVRETEDLLVQPQVSGVLGTSAPGSGPPFINAGTVQNRGVEFSISYKDDIGEDFNFNINYNFTTLENEVLFVGTESGFIPGGSFGVGQEPPSRMEAGFPIGYFFGLQTDGIFQNQTEVDAHATQANAAPGDIRYRDQNGDGVINGDDRVNIGDPIADINMGLNISMNYKNFDFSAYAFASLGGDIVRNYERNQPLTNRTVYYLDRWTGEGTSNTFPRVTTGANSNNLFSDFYVEDGSFLRLQTVQLGYNLGDKVLDKLGLSNARIYMTVSRPKKG